MNRRAVRPAGQLGVPALIQSAMTTGPGAQNFQYALIPFTPGQIILGPNGENISPYSWGTAVAHWYDPTLAISWFQEAQRQATAAVNARNVGGHTDPSGPNPVGLALAALMQGYNALNIPWYMDPEARRLYRLYVSGPPQTVGSNTVLAEYGPHNYNDKWFYCSNQFPGSTCQAGAPCTMPTAMNCSGGGGSYGYAASQINEQMTMLVQQTPELKGTSVYLTPSLWPFVEVPSYLLGSSSGIDVTVNGTVAPGDDPLYAPNIANTMVYGGFIDERQGPPDQNFQGVPQGSGSVARYSDQPNGPNASNSIGWYVYTFFNNSLTGYRQIGIPEVFYVDWMSDWANSVLSRSPQQIVLAARAYTIYANHSQSTQWSGGNDQAFINMLTNLPTTIFTEQTTGPLQNGLKAAAVGVAAVGAALSAFTYGIAGVIGGALSLVLSVASIVVRNGANQPRDEFGRYKPILERGWLAGNPGDPSQFGMPALQIPAAPGSATSASALISTSVPRTSAIVGTATGATMTPAALAAAQRVGLQASAGLSPTLGQPIEQTVNITATTMIDPLTNFLVSLAAAAVGGAAGYAAYKFSSRKAK